ncbi:hypothetical protein TVAG_030750 [Trichomonas vaginalis G3]|uniref:Uncharacterized protein n=1 Tax=Trichomonas vaginalis (strain ATCC PRA-98 / G3) TaxID=412133 RepID=A2EYI3_TRIV3|nr:phosphorylation of RNA polymerase II C-terminal domain [Trichomonas vaginalis G3]EAY02259.1 hypothetical protein TVAG_030750 [Trichomonas vaginalis G3]KAI5522913.1 phosphorylation of RNA polymerase II C-terminal domain [Trichomonas vaginalis G3]|eukprot:XP_001314576.1 hypothetical protein [Trichomonas vaginalis G3]
MNDATHEFLAILIDVNPLEWKEMKDIKFDGFMNHLFLYLKQMILSDCILPPCVLAYNQSHAEFIFPEPGRTKDVINQKFNPTNQEQIKNYFENIIIQIAEFNGRSASIPPTPHVRLDVALSKSLCLMNNLPNKNIKKRILAFSVSPETGSQYDNLLFAAKRLDVVIDVLFLNSNRLCFLSQAADLTHGFSKTIKMGAALAQYLFSLPPTTVRDLMALPAPEPLEYSAPSADTHKMISRGYICPVCLSILEEACRTCPICNTRYGSVNFYINQTEFKSEELKNLL